MSLKIEGLICIVDILSTNLVINEYLNGWFLEREICNPLAYVADRLKKLRGCGHPYLVNVKLVLM